MRLLNRLTAIFNLNLASQAVNDYEIKPQYEIAVVQIRIGSKRQWLAEGRAQSASFREKQQAQQQFVQIQIDPN